MGSLIRFGVSVEETLIESYDELISNNGYTSRSEALRDLMRSALVESRVASSPEKTDAIAALTLVYDRQVRDLTHKINDIQHQSHALILSTLYIQISKDEYMEVIAMKGKVGELRRLGEALLSLKGVKHGDLFITLSASALEKSNPEALVQQRQVRRGGRIKRSLSPPQKSL